jgi:sugar/nucleoside kinase (ribokinase family)
MNLIVTGTISIDTVHTPSGEQREGILGGSCTYFAAAASHYGPVRLVAAVGDDFPQDHRDTLAKFPGIDQAGLETRAGSKTFRWGGKYMENMDERETLFTELGVLDEAPPEIPGAFADSDCVFLANSHPMVQMDLLSRLPEATFVVADTMDLWINIARDELKQLLGKVTGLVLNYEEAEMYTGHRNPVTAGLKMLEDGPEFVVIKKGEHGAILVHKEGLAALPAFPTETVVDPTGAGDTFAGGMMAHIAETGDTSVHGIRRAMAHGTIIASFTIESFSLDRLAGLSRGEIDERYAAFTSMLAIG